MCKRDEFTRCTPEEVGIPSSAVLDLIDKLEQDYTEIHSLMIMRHDRIAAEGWWAHPFCRCCACDT